MPRMSKKRKQEWAFSSTSETALLTTPFAASAAAPVNRASGRPLSSVRRLFPSGQSSRTGKEAVLIADYITTETTLPPSRYIPYPYFLLKMDISYTARLLYALFLDPFRPLTKERLDRQRGARVHCLSHYGDSGNIG